MMRLIISTLFIISIILLGTARPQVFDGTVQVHFNECMDTIGFTDPNNFIWSGGLVTTDVELIDSALAELTVSEPVIFQWYTLEVFNVCDLAGNLINPEKDTTGFVWKEISLPVELNSFTAYVMDQRVHLKWITETEVDNYGFDIERTSSFPSPYQGGGGEAGGGWEMIGFIEGHGNSNSPKTYSFVDDKPFGGRKLKYRLKQIDTDGKYEYSDEIEVEIVPTKCTLYQNYPNPFNPKTTIRYQLLQENKISIKVYDMLGAEIMELLNEKKEPGVYEVELNAESLTSGTYIYRIVAGNFLETKKMILMK